MSGLAVRVGWLEAMCKHCPRGMAVTPSPAQGSGALQNPAYRPADVFENEGSGATTPDPLASFSRAPDAAQTP